MSDNCSTAGCLIPNQNCSLNMMNVSYWQAKAVSVLPAIFLDSAHFNSLCDPLPSTWTAKIAMPSIHYTTVSLCSTHTDAASLGSVVQTHRDGKLDKVKNWVREILTQWIKRRGQMFTQHKSWISRWNAHDVGLIFSGGMYINPA